MLRILITLLFVAAASKGSNLKESEKLTFHVTSSRTVEEAPTIEVTFANGVKDELVLSHYKMNKDAVIGCNYIGILRSSPSSSVGVTGCLNKPGDRMEVTMISENSINKMFSVDFYGNAEIIKSPFEEGASSRAVQMDRGEFDDKEDDDEIFDDDEEAIASVARVGSIPSKLKASIKFGYEDTLQATLNGEDFDSWIAGVFTHTQAHFRQAASLGTTIEFEVRGSASYNQGASWTAETRALLEARDATNALNLDGVDVMSWWCDAGGGTLAGIAFVGKLCTSSNTNLNERQGSSAGSGFILAHELGHTFGMSHDFTDKHGGHSGPCNGQGIMSYGSYSYNQWSTCSRSDWEQHYNSRNWGNTCLEDISVTCKVDGDCSTGEVCANGGSTFAACVKCNVDGDCSTEEVCANGGSTFAACGCVVSGVAGDGTAQGTCATSSDVCTAAGTCLESICNGIKVVTKSYGNENSWTFGACSSAQMYTSQTTTNEHCCQPAGNYELVCKDLFSDGWHGGYLEINGQEYCKEFNTGKEKKEYATMASAEACKDGMQNQDETGVDCGGNTCNACGEEMFWVDDGCARRGTSHDGSFQYKSYEAGVRCCSNDGTTCKTPLKCKNNMMSYVDAVAKCSEDSRRLCSRDELLSGICCGTGGNCDSYEIWTSTV